VDPGCRGRVRGTRKLTCAKGASGLRSARNRYRLQNGGEAGCGSEKAIDDQVCERVDGSHRCTLELRRQLATRFSLRTNSFPESASRRRRAEGLIQTAALLLSFSEPVQLETLSHRHASAMEHNTEIGLTNLKMAADFFGTEFIHFP
jgi:hypothetical protein